MSIVLVEQSNQEQRGNCCFGMGGVWVGCIGVEGCNWVGVIGKLCQEKKL
jgi:hypothetical protein